MISVRNFTGRDVRQVSRLWLKVFSPAQAHSEPPGLEHYLEEVFLQNPWRANHLSSLVCEDREGLSSVSSEFFPAECDSTESLTVAVASQLMIDPDKPLPLASVSLLRHFSTARRICAFSDGANQRALKMWEAGGGSAALLYSAEWTRVLRPAGLRRPTMGAPTVIRFSFPRRPAVVSRPGLGRVEVVTQSPYGVFKPVQTRAEEGVDAAVILDCIREFSARRALQPEYDLSSFRWLLSKAAEQQKHGNLQSTVVKRCCRRDSGVVRVLRQTWRNRAGAAARRESRATSAVCLTGCFYCAHQKGAVAVSGRLEPAFVHALAAARCSFAWSSGVIIQSRNQRLLNAIHRGDAFLSRLEGEWWMRFCDLHPAEA